MKRIPAPRTDGRPRCATASQTGFQAALDAERRDGWPLTGTVGATGQTRDMNWYDRLHMRHRFLRYRYKSERPSILYLLGSDLEGRTLVDIGANKGIYSYYMSKKAGERGAVFCFEPLAEFAEHLEALKEAFRLNNLTVVNEALSSIAGAARLGPGGVILEDSSASVSGAVDVRLTTLDDYFEDSRHRPISFIKCDVEGHEYKVFKGGNKTLRRDKPVLLFECDHDHAEQGDLFSYLTDLDYDGFFYFVRPADHKSVLRRGSGRYIHFSESRNYSYVTPSCPFRMYIFASRGSEAWQQLSAATGLWLPPWPESGVIL